jgi:CheY-like chemotaxis protein
MPPEAPPLSSARTRIVIADDDRFFVEFLRIALAEHDEFEVVATAANGEQAVERVEEFKPSLVLLDVTMPVLDGLEATRRIRLLPDPPAVILITGDDAEADNVAAYEAGAAAYLRKTPDLPKLIGMILAVSRLNTAATPV